MHEQIWELRVCSVLETQIREKLTRVEHVTYLVYSQRRDLVMSVMPTRNFGSELRTCCSRIDRLHSSPLAREWQLADSSWRQNPNTPCSKYRDLPS